MPVAICTRHLRQEWNKMTPIHGTKWPLYMEQNSRYTWNKMAAIHGTKWPPFMEQNGPCTWDKMVQEDFSRYNFCFQLSIFDI